MEKANLINLLQQQDMQALPLFLQEFGPLMHYIIAPILPDPREQEECLSDVTLRVWENCQDFDARRGSWTTWLTAITRNAALNRARRQSTHAREQDIPLSFPSAEAGPEEALLRAELRDHLASAIDDLSWSDRIFFYRKYYYLQSTAQIAAELRLSERAVEGRLYRLRKKLRHMLGGDSFE